MGNAELKLNNYARAILNYEKALLLEEREDITNNLGLAKDRILDPIPEFDDFFLKKWWLGLLEFFGANGWLIVGFIFLCLAAYGFTKYIKDTSFRKTSTIVMSVAILIIGLFSIFLSIRAADLAEKSRHAIVLNEGSSMHEAADEKSAEVRLLSAGIKVKIIDQIGDWLKIRLPDKDVGWMPASGLGYIEDAFRGDYSK